MRAWWLLFLILPGFLLAQLPVEVRDAWVREAPPGASVNAGYLVMKNTSKQAQRLQHIRSKQFQAVELHQTLMEGGIAKMLAVPDLEIPAGGEITFGPGGYHLMLMEPKDRPVAGSQVEISLRFASGLEIPVSMLVKKQDAGADEHQHHH
jgi:copper(I)-binding protein